MPEASLLDEGGRAWEELWRDMPSFDHRDLEPIRSLTVHFATEADVRAFADLVGQNISVKTKSLWYPKAEIGHFAGKKYVSANGQKNPRYPVYVISKGRWESRLTSRALESIGVPYRIVVEPQEYDFYAAVIAPEKILTLPFSNLGQGSIPARNWVWDHALKRGTKRHWILDDNIQGFYRFENNLKCPVGDGTTFAACEAFVDRYANVALAGMQYFMFVTRKSDRIPPIQLNTRIYSCILIDNAAPYRWRGRYNEDTDLSIRILKDGLCTVLFNAFLAFKMPTMTMKGGNTDELYRDDGRLLMAESLREQHPDIVQVTQKWGRAQHHVDYRGFRFNRLVPRPDADATTVADDFAMTLEVEEPAPRRPPKEVRSVPAAPPEPPPVLFFAPRSVSAVLEAVAPPESTPTTERQGPTVPVPQQPVVALGARPLRTVPAAQPVVAPVYSYQPPTKRGLPMADPFLEAWRARLDAAGEDRLAFDEATWDRSVRSPVAMDVELFRNFMCVCFKRLSDGSRLAFEKSDRCELDVRMVEAVLRDDMVVTFNGLHYDVPILAMALDGADLGRLKEVSDRIVRENGLPDRQPRGVVPDHVDLLETNPSVRQGLKMLHARLHGRYVVDLPFDPDATLSHREMNFATAYCMNDLDATHGLFDALREPLALREALGRTYGADFRSKSDAQMGEAIVVRSFEARTRRRVGRVDNLGRLPQPWRYEPPAFVSFSTPRMRGIVDRLRAMEFRVNGVGEVVPPPEIAGLTAEIAGVAYSMGIGGLHSQEAHRTLRSDAENVLDDIDVSSQYPRIISRLGMHPPALGPEFVEVYSELIERRIAAKRAGDRTTADGLKIGTNGVFGKLGSFYSALYSPQMMVATTLTGQLSVLGIIEAATEAGFEVVSANTDGVTFLYPRVREAELRGLVAAWEARTDFEVEWTRYRSLHNLSVNTYVAIREDGKAKRKGPIADPWSDGDTRVMLGKNPQMTVVSEAILRHLRDGAPVAETIAACTDPRAFVTVVNVKGGAKWRGAPIGRVARYYWSTDGDPILYASNDRRVANTEGARPMMEITGEVPRDLDLGRYARVADGWLVDLGAKRKEGSLL